MSLILEALRKSEAERQLGRAPGLLTPMPSAPPRRSRLLPALILPPLLVLVAAGGWWFGRGALPEPAAPSPLASSPEVGSPEVSSPEVGSPDVSSPDASVAAEPSPTVVAAAVEPAPAAAPAAVTRPVAAPAEPLRSRAPQPSAPTLAERAPVAAEPAPPASVGDAPSSVAAAPPDGLAARPPIEPAQEPALESLPTLPTLAAPLRDGLPPLRMSMHVYAEPVEQRFVLIDGHRYVEGQTIDSRLQVAEIRRDGVVLSVDGERFLLPRS